VIFRNYSIRNKKGCLKNQFLQFCAASE